MWVCQAVVVANCGVYLKNHSDVESSPETCLLAQSTADSAAPLVSNSTEPLKLSLLCCQAATSKLNFFPDVFAGLHADGRESRLTLALNAAHLVRKLIILLYPAPA